MNTERTLKVIAVLKEIYEAEFGGKDQGRFKIARDHMLSLMGVSRLYDSDSQHLVDEAFKQGVVLINADSYFHVILLPEITNWRPAPKRVVSDSMDKHFPVQ